MHAYLDQLSSSCLDMQSAYTPAGKIYPGDIDTGLASYTRNINLDGL